MSNKLKLFFLGNCASAPTSIRNLTSVLINYNGQNYLFDCPENTQQQIMKAKQSAMKIEHIFITHLHGDHYFGLFGLLSSFKLNNRTTKLFIYVPKGYKKQLETLIKLTIYDTHPPEYEIEIKEIDNGKIYDTQELYIETFNLEHTIKTNGFIFKIKDKIGKFNKSKALKLKIPEGPLFSKLQQGKTIRVKGKTIKPKDVMDYNYKKIGVKIAYLTDTAVLRKIPKKLNDIDILIHESTFFKEDSKKADLVKHSYAEKVLEFSKKVNAKKIYLTHISSKYTNLEEKEKQLQKLNKNVKIVNSLEEIETKDYL